MISVLYLTTLFTFSWSFAQFFFQLFGFFFFTGILIILSHSEKNPYFFFTWDKINYLYESVESNESVFE